MNYGKLNKRLESSELYQFTQRHKRTITIVQGIFIILLLISMNVFVVKDHFIKKQIASKCGYETSKYTCICDQNYIDAFNEMNITINEDG